MKKDYAKLKQLLEEQETFPLEFTHKFIGRNTPGFATGVGEFEKRFNMTPKNSRMSSGDAHVALTYVFIAKDADEVITVLEATGEIEDVLVVL